MANSFKISPAAARKALQATSDDNNTSVDEPLSKRKRVASFTATEDKQLVKSQISQDPTIGTKQGKISGNVFANMGRKRKELVRIVVYEVELKMSFKFRDCWELFKDVPKWRNYCGVDAGVSKSAASVEDEDNENSVHESADDHMESTSRPKGCKSAKKMVVDKLERSKQENAKQKALEQTK
ncbi:hypothetical protein HDU79_011630 [Rhizoclosmatium sp. JEL0117]|nr:hypothetical protein HDU79_011630 [Rhizoclosmatium sp. JEL0117]